MLRNPYVFEDFWHSRSYTLPPEVWKDRFYDANRAAQRTLGQHGTVTVLGVVLWRIQTLSNQIIHIGATWNSSVNRAQLRELHGQARAAGDRGEDG